MGAEATFVPGDTSEPGLLETEGDEVSRATSRSVSAMVGWDLVQVVVVSRNCARSRTASEEASKGYPARTSMGFKSPESARCSRGVGVVLVMELEREAACLGGCCSGRSKVLSVCPPATSSQGRQENCMRVGK